MLKSGEMKKIKKMAVVFDMDGVVSDTQTLHAQVEEKMLRHYGIKITAKKITEKYAGVPDNVCFTEIFKEYKVKVNLDKFIAEKWKKVLSLARKNVSPIEGSIKLINDLKKAKFKLGLASSSPLRFIKLVLSKLKLQHEFNAISSGEEVKRGKPHPDIFLLTAKKLNVRPDLCVAIEDGKSGMVAAKAAKMRCVGLVTTKEGKYPADLIVTSLYQLSTKIIKKLLEK